MTKFIPSYDASTDLHEIQEYDTENGFRVVHGPYSTMIFIWHNSVIVSSAFDSLREAVAGCGEWSAKPVRLPDGSIVKPSEYLHPDYKESPFIQWHPGVIELWPGEY